MQPDGEWYAPDGRPGSVRVELIMTIDVESIIWYGRRLAYLGQFREAIDVYSNWRRIARLRWPLKNFIEIAKWAATRHSLPGRGRS